MTSTGVEKCCAGCSRIVVKCPRWWYIACEGEGDARIIFGEVRCSVSLGSAVPVPGRLVAGEAQVESSRWRL